MNHLENFKESVDKWKLYQCTSNMDIYVKMYLYMNDIFYNIKKAENYDKLPLSTFYDTRGFDKVLEEDLKYDMIWLCSRAFYHFKKEFEEFITDDVEILSMFHEYITRNLNLKGSRTFWMIR